MEEGVKEGQVDAEAFALCLPDWLGVRQKRAARERRGTFLPKQVQEVNLMQRWRNRRSLARVVEA